MSKVQVITQKVQNKLLLALCSFIIMATCMLNTVQRADAASLINLTSSELIDRINSEDGEYRVLLFFTSWCPKCKDIMEKMVDLRNNTGLRIYDISIDNQYTAIRQFVDNMNRDVNIYYLGDANQIQNLFSYYGIMYRDSVPHLVLIGRREGVIADGCTLGYIINHLSAKGVL